MVYKIVKENIFINNDIYILDSLIEEMNEGIGDNIHSVISKLVDKKKALSNVIHRFNNETNINSKKKLARIIVVIFISLYGSGLTYKALITDEAKQNTIASVIAHDDETSISKIFKYFNELVHGKKEVKNDIPEIVKFNDALSYSTSHIAKETIKNYEKLRLKGYRIKGDGKITIGWGHAEPVKTSKFKVGQVISKNLADQLFEQDIKNAEDGVKRIFSQWKENGNDVKISQGMFDAMVSIAYNAGIDGLRTSAFIQMIKRKKFNEAEKEISNVRNSGKFPGLDRRRSSEQELYRM